MNLESIISICLGIGLAASVGFRLFLPLFALSLASYFNILELNESWQWIGSLSALLILGVATIVEIFAYFIPYVDNLLDSIAVPLAALAGTMIMLSTVADLSPEITWALAIIAGGGTAAAIAGTSSAARLTSTVTTGGIGNPVISTVETGTSILMSLVSIIFPVLAIILVLVIFLIIFKFYKKFTNSKG
ncbi:MAG: DUF4126 domain-containing protein [Flavobacteriales bacterium]|nr:DUF4126 domain-containing protein [Flavobacteriales bacterium]PIV92703.1 MAG: DUF4126 domain-containing protein [Flavobacteriaceae bacterium CG17_big_fil_post_rev_8_21_14_2_50_33_15]PIY11555.1 MAG: DUF4126 domain-containing protein [Flavobacteriaceae bacterium CG_4_10_14_3_um_filter_33_47]PJB17514.1 MAG: DUF4126 domain-containing protein [Flavobacteriaceae bacterium CG_4_9_14_3_um_filter_33_16]NCP53244.1 DUF4126 domain-containing protein [Flavobacteriales bacterium]